MTQDKRIKVEIGERLRLLNESLKISQTAFAQALGVKQGFLNQILMGHKAISGKVIYNLGIRFNRVSLRWLLFGEGEMFEWPLYHARLMRNACINAIRRY